MGSSKRLSQNSSPYELSKLSAHSLKGICWESAGSPLGVRWESAGSSLGVRWESAGSLLGFHLESAGSSLNGLSKKALQIRSPNSNLVESVGSLVGVYWVSVGSLICRIHGIIIFQGSSLTGLFKRALPKQLSISAL